MGYLNDTLILLIAAVVVVPLFQFLRLGSVLGFLAAGVAVGPAGLGMIGEVEQIRSFAELGVVFLLFIIGIELKPARLWLMRRMVFGLGTTQVIFSGLLITALLWLFGVELRPALVLGLGLALSSTAFVLQLLIERRELNSGYGRSAFAILLLQDLAVVPLLALVPLLADPEGSFGSDVLLVLAESLGVIALVVLGGRILLRPVLQRIARHGGEEIFLATALLLVLGIATLIEHAGMSMAMGAFIAGLLIADSEYRHQILADIQPFRGLLLGLFFISVGMSVEPGVLIDSPLRMVGMLLALLAVKAAALWVSARLFGIRHQDARNIALLLPQGGEFGFVLFGAAQLSGLFDDRLYQEAVMVVVMSMVLTPLLASRINARLTQEPEEPLAMLPEGDGAEAKVVIAGFGRMGMRIASLMHEAEIPYVAIEQHPSHVSGGRNKGFAVFYGNASNHEVLKAAGVGEAELLIIAIDDADVVARLVSDIRIHYPKLPIYARGHSRSRCAHLLGLGASGVASENLEASLQLARYAMTGSGLDEEQADEMLDKYRASYYDYLEQEAVAENALETAVESSGDRVSD